MGRSLYPEGLCQGFTLQKDLCATAEYGLSEVLHQETAPAADSCATVFSVNSVNIGLSSPILL